MSDKEKARCPKCDAPIGSVVAQVFDSSTVTLKLGTNNDELLSAETVGGAITNSAKLFKMAAKDCGYAAEVLVRSIEYKDGEVLVKLMVCRLQPGLKKRQRKELVRRMVEESGHRRVRCE